MYLSYALYQRFARLTGSNKSERELKKPKEGLKTKKDWKISEMTPKWRQSGPMWSQRTQIPNCFEAGLEMTPKWFHFGVHFGVFFESIFGDFLEPTFFVFW